MNINNLNGGLPAWKDGRDNEGEGWKERPTLQACKALYEKWSEIINMLNGALGTVRDIAAEEADNDEAAFAKDIKAMMFGDAYEAGAKIRSSEAGEGMYIIRMENAAVVRKNAQFVKSSVLSLMLEGEIEEDYGEVIREEIDVFRELFKTWVSTFEKDEYVDDWGLFI